MSENVYVRYAVQKGDTLWDLWRATGMTQEEWVSVNNGRDPKRILKTGEEIVIKDPIQTCTKDAFENRMRIELREFGFSVGRGGEDACYSKHSAFKPLRQFTTLLTTPAHETMLPPGKEFRTGGLEGVI